MAILERTPEEVVLLGDSNGFAIKQSNTPIAYFEEEAAARQRFKELSSLFARAKQAGRMSPAMRQALVAVIRQDTGRVESDLTMAALMRRGLIEPKLSAVPGTWRSFRICL